MSAASLRIIGDPILHQAGILFPVLPTIDELTELERQIAIAREVLITAGGLGIAANQCADIAKPYRFIIVGVYHEIKTHVARTKQRYPDLIFPQARLILNPQVINESETMQVFRHACLSIPSGLRAEIITPKTITLSYLTLESGHLRTCEEIYIDLAAVILQHELNHINAGLTYFDRCLMALSAEDRKVLAQILDEAVSHIGHIPSSESNRQGMKSHANQPPSYHCMVSVDASGRSVLHPDVLKHVLAAHPHIITCLGLQQRLRFIEANYFH